MFSKEAIQQLQLAEAISAANKALGNVNGLGAIALPSDIKIHDLEPYMEQRRRMRGLMVAPTLVDFATYVEMYADVSDDSTTPVFVDHERMAAEAVLNMGNPGAPQHADHRARYEPQTMAAFDAMRAVCDTPLTQQRLAEFLEDWSPYITAYDDDAMWISPAAAVAAVRKITIENLNKLESTAQRLSIERSEFEKVAVVGDVLPARFDFKCIPYTDLSERNFSLRLSVVTGDKAPKLMLRIAAWERHQQEMAAEVVHLVRTALGSKQNVMVMVGTYSRG